MLLFNFFPKRFFQMWYFVGILTILFFCKVTDIKAENLIKNSSFELGLSQVTPAGELHFIKAGSYHGNHYALWKAGKGWICFSPMKLPVLPGTYTFSVYLRTNKPNKTGQLGFINHKWKRFWGKRIRLKTKWERYSYTVNLKPYDPDPHMGKENIYTPVIFANTPNAELHIDAVQLERGPLAGYGPKKKIEIGGWTDRYANVFIGDDDIRFTAAVSNYTGSEQVLDLNVVVTDIYDRKLLEHDRKIKLNASEVMEIPFRLNFKGKGHFRVFLRGNKGATPIQHVLNLARIWSLKDGSRYHPNSGMGIHASFANYNDPEIEKKRWRLVAESGARWIRLFFNRKRVEPRKGKIDWSYYDKRLEFAERNKLKVLGVFSIHQPNWIKKGVEILNQTEFMDFCLKAVKRYPNIDVWEIFNEPYTRYPKKNVNPTSKEKRFFDLYVHFHKKFYRRVKKIDPHKTLLINACGPYQKKENMGFLRSASSIPESLLNYCDGISYHLYPGYYPGREAKRYYTTQRLIKDILKKHGREHLHLWQTEMGISSDDLFDDENNLYIGYRLHMKRNAFGYGPELDGAQSFVKYHIVQMARGVKVSFYFQIGTNYPYFSLFTLFKDRWLSPKIIYPAYNALAAILDESQFIKEISRSEKVRMYAFKKGDQCIISYWSEKRDYRALQLKGLSWITVKDFMENEILNQKGTDTYQLPLSTFPQYILIDVEELQNLQAKAYM